jgi:hypothetical protein
MYPPYTALDMLRVIRDEMALDEQRRRRTERDFWDGEDKAPCDEPKSGRGRRLLALPTLLVRRGAAEA